MVESFVSYGICTEHAIVENAKLSNNLPAQAAEYVSDNV